MQDNFANFFRSVDVKFSIAVIIMSLIFVIICGLLFVMITLFKNRRKKVGVELPPIDGSGNKHYIPPQFKSQASGELSVELIDPDDDVINGEEDKNDDEFMKVLSSEAREFIPIETPPSVEMPEIGDINYEKIKEEKMKEMQAEKEQKEKEAINKLRELAKADSEEDL